MKTEWEFTPYKTSHRLDQIVKEHLGISRSEAQIKVVTGLTLVDGVVRRKVSYKVSNKALITVSFSKKASDTPLVPLNPALQVVYNDKDLAVIDKPAGLTVHSGHKNRSGTLSDHIKVMFETKEVVGEPGREFIVHRLDKDTSGLMVVALSEAGYKELKRMVEKHEFSRTYKALVWGTPKLKQGVVFAPIGRDIKNPLKRGVVSHGKEAVSRYQVSESFGKVSLLQVQIETGRTHQIRVHLASINLPIVGDLTYGRKTDSKIGLKRQFLHSYKLVFRHPITKEAMSYRSNLPKDLYDYYNKLKSLEVF